jgi:hypothetical protein
MADDGESSEANEEVYEVEAIVGDRKRRGVQEFLVKWKGFRQDKNTWATLEDLEGSADLVDAYMAAKFRREDAAIRRKPVVRSDSDPDLLPSKKEKEKAAKRATDKSAGRVVDVVGVTTNDGEVFFQVQTAGGEEVTLSRSKLSKLNPSALLAFIEAVIKQ